LIRIEEIIRRANSVAASIRAAGFILHVIVVPLGALAVFMFRNTVPNTDIEDKPFCTAKLTGIGCTAVYARIEVRPRWATQVGKCAWLALFCMGIEIEPR